MPVTMRVSPWFALGVAAVAAVLTGGNWNVPVAAWFGPALLLYFTRSRPGPAGEGAAPPGPGVFGVLLLGGGGGGIRCDRRGPDVCGVLCVARAGARGVAGVSRFCNRRGGVLGRALPGRPFARAARRRVRRDPGVPPGHDRHGAGGGGDQSLRRLGFPGAHAVRKSSPHAVGFRDRNLGRDLPHLLVQLNPSPRLS